MEYVRQRLFKHFCQQYLFTRLLAYDYVFESRLKMNNYTTLTSM